MKFSDLGDNGPQFKLHSVTEGILDHPALEGWDAMSPSQKASALQKAGFKKPFRPYTWSDKGDGQFTWDGWSGEELDDILHAARVKAANQADELSMSASDRRAIQRQAKQDFEEQRQQLFKEKMEMERFAWEKANTEAERKHEIAKIEKEYLHDLRKLQMSHMQDMEKILHADTHELNKMKAEFNMRQAEREKEKPQQPPEQDEPNMQDTSGQNFDQDTGEPLNPQQSNQWHTSQQLSNNPARPDNKDDDDVIDVEARPVSNKPPALGNSVKKESADVKRAVDSKGRTQQQWIKAVYAQFRAARIIQSKMIDGPCYAMLPDGRKLSWNKAEQSVAEGDIDEASLAQMRDYFNQADADSVKVDRNYDAPSKKQNPLGVPPEIQALVNKMYHAGKISPQEFEVLRKFQQKTKINVGIREADKNPYAIGMAQAMKSTGDKPPLKKSTINKAHEIARAIKKDQ